MVAFRSCQPLGASTADVQQNAIVLVDLARLNRLQTGSGHGPGVMMSMPSVDSIVALAATAASRSTM